MQEEKEFKKSIETLVIKNQLNSALNKLKPVVKRQDKSLYRLILLLESSLHDIKRRYQSNIEDSSFLMREVNKIKKHILDILDDVEIDEFLEDSIIHSSRLQTIKGFNPVGIWELKIINQIKEENYVLTFLPDKTIRGETTIDTNTNVDWFEKKINTKLPKIPLPIKGSWNISEDRERLSITIFFVFSFIKRVFIFDVDSPNNTSFHGVDVGFKGTKAVLKGK